MPVFLEDVRHVVKQIFFVELARRKVDGYRQFGQSLALPCDVLLACIIENPTADGNDQAGFLGDRNESRRSERAELCRSLA
jgi:hypothetical protein